MGFLDKLLGRGKKTAGDMTGDSSPRGEGMAPEPPGGAEDRAAQHEQMAQAQPDQAGQAAPEQERQ